MVKRGALFMPERLHFRVAALAGWLWHLNLRLLHGLLAHGTGGELQRLNGSAAQDIAQAATVSEAAFLLWHALRHHSI